MTFYIEGKLKIFFPIPIQELLFTIFQTDRYNHNTLEKSHNNNLNPDNKLKLKILITHSTILCINLTPKN